VKSEIKKELSAIKDEPSMTQNNAASGASVLGAEKLCIDSVIAAGDM